MKQRQFLHVDTNSQKLKVDFFSWAWSKMGVANLVSGFWNWLYLQNEQMELTDLKDGFWNEHGQKWEWPVWWRDSKTDCIWRIDRWKKLIQES